MGSQCQPMVNNKGYIPSTSSSFGSIYNQQVRHGEGHARTHLDLDDMYIQPVQQHVYIHNNKRSMLQEHAKNTQQCSLYFDSRPATTDSIYRVSSFCQPVQLLHTLSAINYRLSIIALLLCYGIYLFTHTVRDSTLVAGCYWGRNGSQATERNMGQEWEE